MNEDRDGIIVLIDENGEEVEAEYIDTIEYRGAEYVVLLPKDNQEDDEDSESEDCGHNHDHENGECCCDEEEVVILKIIPGADEEEDTYVAIEDEAEQDAVFDIFTKRMEEEDEED